MALKDALKAGPASRVMPDKISEWRAGLDDETRAAFDAAVKDPAWGDSTLADTLTAEGFKVAAPTIRRYRLKIGVK